MADYMDGYYKPRTIRVVPDAKHDWTVSHLIGLYDNDYLKEQRLKQAVAWVRKHASWLKDNYGNPTARAFVDGVVIVDDSADHSGEALCRHILMDKAFDDNGYMTDMFKTSKPWV